MKKQTSDDDTSDRLVSFKLHFGFAAVWVECEHLARGNSSQHSVIVNIADLLNAEQELDCFQTSLSGGVVDVDRFVIAAACKVLVVRRQGQ